MNEMRLNEEDKQKLVEFLNLVAKHAKFNFDTAELIQYYKSLSYMQQRLLAKIDANILEVKRVINPPVEEQSQLEVKKGKKQ